MKLTHTEEQEQLAQTARDFFASTTPIERVRKLRDTRDATGFSRDVWKKMGDLGFVGCSLPEEYGGMGLGFTELCIVLEEAGRKLAPEPLVASVLLGAEALLLGGSAAQKAEYVPKIATGEAIVTVAWQERDRRFDPARVSTTAERTPKGIRLTGEKRDVLDASSADAFVVSAASGKSGEAASLYLVGAKTTGLVVSAQNRIDGRSAALVRFDGVEVPEDALLGPSGGAQRILQAVLERAAIGLAAEMLGGASQIFEDTLAYLKTRRQFDVPIGSFQALQHRAARLFVELSLARAAVVGAAAAVDQEPARVPRLSALAKARLSDTFMHVAHEAVQMHGGIGVTDEHHLGFYLKRARVAEMTFGDAAWHRRRWAELGGY